MLPLQPFHAFMPVPILPAAQVQATSYEQHLAYLEWYINYLAKNINASEVKANETLEGGEADLTELTVGGIKYAVPQGGGSTDNAAVRAVKPSSVAVGSNSITVNYADLPSGAVIDEMVLVVGVSGGTVPRIVRITPKSSTTALSSDQGGGNGYCNWTRSKISAGGTTADAFSYTTQTLWTTGYNTGDTGDADSSRIYYHIEA